MNKTHLNFTLLFLISLLLSCTGVSVNKRGIDSNGNPIFNSITLKEEEFSNYGLSTNYYTIIGNINNENSSVFISKEPTNDEVWNFATNLSSYFWIIHQNRVVSKMVSLNQISEGHTTKWSWLIVDVTNGNQVIVPSNFYGDITEHRFLELFKTEELLSDNLLETENRTHFIQDMKSYTITPYKLIKKELIRIIDEYKLYDPSVDIYASKITSNMTFTH